MNSSIRYVLASSSPRRQDLLASLHLDFEVLKPDFEEKLNSGETPGEYVLRNARGKAASSASLLTKRPDIKYLVIGADTIVVLNQEILQKPENEEHAYAMLRKISGQTHLVLTGLCVASVLYDKETEYHTHIGSTHVTIKHMDDEEIRRYIRTGEPLDKAGSYGIQGYGACLIREIMGSYTNVVGLPLTELKEMLDQISQKP
ncbi:MAG: septum formation inhibitor Maf [Deltaproteobacteria bacterium]|nr:septum formation inhibitor Maf [Deltaproteobacteria bacterium]